MNFSTGVLIVQIDWKSHFGRYEIRNDPQNSQVTSYKRLTLYLDTTTLLIRSYRSLRFNCPGFSS